MVSSKDKANYVKACPGHRTIEDEQICINEDPIKHIVTFDVNKNLIGTEFNPAYLQMKTETTSASASSIWAVLRTGTIACHRRR
ncbi:MAG: hypothetical protein ACFFCP_15365 [Promethearchaeota archaeon]